MKNYDGTMIMPANYAVVTNEEMTYLDGGVYVTRRWWGSTTTFTKYDCQKIMRYYEYASYYTTAIGIPGTLGLAKIVGSPVAITIGFALASAMVAVRKGANKNGVNVVDNQFTRSLSVRVR